MLNQLIYTGITNADGWAHGWACVLRAFGWFRPGGLKERGARACGTRAVVRCGAILYKTRSLGYLSLGLDISLVR